MSFAHHSVVFVYLLKCGCKLLYFACIASIRVLGDTQSVKICCIAVLIDKGLLVSISKYLKSPPY